MKAAIQDLISRVEKLMGPREFFTIAQLVKMGIFGSKSGAWRGQVLSRPGCTLALNVS